MRLLIVTSLAVPLLLVSACNRPQTIAGTWACTTTHPGGFASKDTFRFGENGQLDLDSNGVVMHGSYEVAGKGLVMKLTDVPVPDPYGRRAVQQQTLKAVIQKLTGEEMALEVSTGHNSHVSQCRRS